MQKAPSIVGEAIVAARESAHKASQQAPPLEASLKAPERCTAAAVEDVSEEAAGADAGSLGAEGIEDAEAVRETAGSVRQLSKLQLAWSHCTVDAEEEDHDAIDPRS